MVNRAALILRYKDPAVRWINEADPDGSPDDATLATVNEERTVYLIEESACADPKRLEAWLKKNYVQLFDAELEGWYTDPGLWPSKRTYKLFREWFTPEVHTVLVDLGTDDIFDDGA